MKTEIDKLALELKVVLQQEVRLLENLQELMQDERELLLSFRPRQLLEINKRKEILIGQRNSLEGERHRLTDRLTVLLCLPKDADLATLAEAVEGQAGAELRRLRSILAALVDGIRELATLNAALIEHSIRSIRGSVTFLKKRFFNSDTYGADGAIRHREAELSSVQNRV